MKCVHTVVDLLRRDFQVVADAFLPSIVLVFVKRSITRSINLYVRRQRLKKILIGLHQMFLRHVLNNKWCENVNSLIVIDRERHVLLVFKKEKVSQTP